MEEMKERLFIGTSGWSYPKGAGTWDGTFYPPKMKDSDKLAFYAQYFNTVEINSTFYRPPSPYAARAWASKVPEDFRFTAKLWQKFTHPKMFEAATGQAASVQDEDFGVFAEGIGPLAEAGKLGPLLAQFPTSFRPDPGTLEYLEDLIRRMRGAGFLLAVELRHREWTESEETAAIRALMEEQRVAWVITDEPRFKTSIRHVPLTSDIAYFRFHGGTTRTGGATANQRIATTTCTRPTNSARLRRTFARLPPKPPRRTPSTTTTTAPRQSSTPFS